MKHLRPLLRTCTRRYSAAPNPYNILETGSFPAPHTGSIAVLSLNRPKAKNALSRPLLTRLQTALKTLDPSVRALIISSSHPGIFCAGADLVERATFSQAQTTAFLAQLRETFRFLHELKIPTIAAISGYALGGGLELALCTDFRVVSSTAVLALPETRLGIIPGAGGTYRLAQVVGKAKALDMILTGRRVGAEEARALGLVNRVVQETEALGGEVQGAIDLANAICEGGPVAVVAAKRAVLGGGEVEENEAYGMVVGTEDRNEALTAFAEKRKPKFRGR